MSVCIGRSHRVRDKAGDALVPMGKGKPLKPLTEGDRETALHVQSTKCHPALKKKEDTGNRKA